MIPLIRLGSRVMRSRVLQVRLSNAFARSAGARRALIIVFRARLSGARLLPLVGISTPIPAPAYPLSARVLRPAAAAGYSAGSVWARAAVMSWVEPGSAGLTHSG